jgi:hypothetical protein
MNAPVTLAQVLSVWMQAKEDERKAIERRRDLDKTIQSMLPKKDEGSITETTEDYKATVTYKMTRSVDADMLAGMWSAMSEQAQKAFKWKAEASTTELRKLQEFRPDDYAFVAAAITTKPASASVSVELITKE